MMLYNVKRPYFEGIKHLLASLLKKKSKISTVWKNQQPYTYSGLVVVENWNMVGVGWVWVWISSYEEVQFWCISCSLGTFVALLKDLSHPASIRKIVQIYTLKIDVFQIWKMFIIQKNTVLVLTLL